MCKQPLLRVSMSMQAIHLTTHESGPINSHVTNTILPQPTHEDINDVSPIKPSPQTHSDQLCPVTLKQQTTPIAPIPPVDPMTSTPIRKASFTPVFTPNNIRVVRDDTENVLTLSDEMNQSKKVSVVNKVNSRNNTPSSLTTHVVTPIEQISVNERERMLRINTIAHEIHRTEKAINLDGPQCDNSPKETMDVEMLKSNEKDTPRSVRVSNRKNSFHEESHLVKHRVRSRQTYRHSPHTMLRRKDTLVVSRLSLLNSSADKMTTDVSTKPSEDVEIIHNTPISILDDTIPPKLSSSNNPSPVAVSKGNERVALSHSVSFLNDSLSPHLLHDMSKYKRISPKSKSSPTVTHKSCKQTKKTTRVTQNKQVSNNNTFLKSRVRRPVSIYSSEESSDNNQSVFSPLLDSSVLNN